MRTYTASAMVVLSVIMLGAMGCGGESSPLPDIDATVEAKVQVELATEATIEARVKERLAKTMPKAIAMPTAIEMPTAIAMPSPVATPIPTSTPVPPTPLPTSLPIPFTTQSKLSTSSLIETLKPSVVLIISELADGNYRSGTGLIYSSEGLVLTNYHVVAGAITLTVFVTDIDDSSLVVEAGVLGTNSEIDLAVIRLDGGPYIAAELGSISEIDVGDEVLALGYPLSDLTGNSLTVTKGIISNIRNDGTRNVLQHQASINPGNSGGPLVSTNGSVVGVNTYILRRSEGEAIEGFNMAVAIDEAVSRLDQLETQAFASESVGSQVIANEAYGFTFTIPKGWYLLYEMENSYYAIKEDGTASFALEIDDDTSGFSSGEQWANYWYDIGTSGLDDYVLIDSSSEVDSDGLESYSYIEGYFVDDVGYVGGEFFLYSPYAESIRMYLEASVDTFEESLPDLDQITSSFVTIDDSDPSTAYFNSGLENYDSGNFDQAIKDFTEAINLNPQDFHLHYVRGNAYLSAGIYELAIDDYNKVINSDPMHAEAYAGRGSAYFHLGQVEKAVEDFNQSLEIDPQYTLAYHNRARALFSQGEMDRALRDFDKAIAVDPQFAKAYFGRAVIYSKQGKTQKAIDGYTNAIIIDPLYADPLHNRGVLYARQGNRSLAIEDYTQAILIDPKSAQAYYSRGIEYGELEKYDLALADYTKAIYVDPTYADAYYNRGFIYYNQGKYIQAIQDLSQVIILEPMAGDAFLARGNLYNLTNQQELADSDLKRAKELGKP